VAAVVTLSSVTSSTTPLLRLALSLTLSLALSLALALRIRLATTTTSSCFAMFNHFIYNVQKKIKIIKKIIIK